MSFLLAWMYAINALLNAATPPPDQFVSRMFSHGDPVVAPGSFVGVGFHCHRHDPHMCLAGMVWIDGQPQYEVVER